MPLRNRMAGPDTRLRHVRPLPPAQAHGPRHHPAHRRQLTAHQGLGVGTTPLNFVVPLTATVDATIFARFRLDTGGGLTPTGAADDGEVEDYLVSILPPIVSSGYFVTQQEITSAENRRQALIGQLEEDQERLRVRLGEEERAQTAGTRSGVREERHDGVDSRTPHASTATAAGPHRVTNRAFV